MKMQDRNTGRNWKVRLAAAGATSMLVMVGLAAPSGAHDAGFDPNGHVHAAGLAPKDTFCANLLSGAESLNQSIPAAYVDPKSPGVDDPVWGENAKLYGPGGYLTWPSSLGVYGPGVNAGDAVDYHWVHDDPRVAHQEGSTDTIEPLVFDFGVPVSTVDYYPFHDHPDDPTGDPFSGRVYGSNDPNVLGTPLDLVTVWDDGWDPANPTTYVDDFVQRYVITQASGPVRYISILTDVAYRHDSEVDAVCTPEAPPEGPPPPAGQIAPTATTCQDFANDTAADLDTLQYGVRNGKIGNVAPGVFFYYSEIVAPAATFTIDVVQSDDGATPPFSPQNLSNVRLWTADCTVVSSFTATIIDGQVHYNVTNATPGATYFVSVKYTSTAPVGHPAPNPSTVTYEFGTSINGIALAGLEDTVALVKK